MMDSIGLVLDAARRAVGAFCWEIHITLSGMRSGALSGCTFTAKDVVHTTPGSGDCQPV